VTNSHEHVRPETTTVTPNELEPGDRFVTAVRVYTATRAMTLRDGRIVTEVEELRVPLAWRPGTTVEKLVREYEPGALLHADWQLHQGENLHRHDNGSGETIIPEFESVEPRKLGALDQFLFGSYPAVRILTLIEEVGELQVERYDSDRGEWTFMTFEKPGRVIWPGGTRVDRVANPSTWTLGRTKA
jgi:hypothetical protein